MSEPDPDESVRAVLRMMVTVHPPGTLTDTTAGVVDVGLNITGADDAVAVLTALHQVATDLLVDLCHDIEISAHDLSEVLTRISQINRPAIEAVTQRHAYEYQLKVQQN